MFFIFTAISFLCFNVCFSLHAMDSGPDDDFLEISSDYDSAYDAKKHEKSSLVPILMATAMPVVDVVNAAGSYAYRQAASMHRKANPDLYVIDEKNPALYQGVIDALQSNEVSFSAVEHDVHKCLNRLWYGSQALMSAFRAQDSEYLDKIIANNSLILQTDLNNAIAGSLQRAKAKRELNPQEGIQAQAGRKFNPLSDVVVSYNVLDSEQRRKFTATIETLANKKCREFLKDAQCMQKLEDAQRFQYAIAKQLVDHAKWLDKNKQQAETVGLHIKATQISRMHHATLAPVLKPVAKWAVKQEAAILKTQLDEASQASGLLEIVWY